MPGIATHHIFGIEAHRALPELIGKTQSCREAFLSGNLGPDPFFYLAVSPAWQQYRRLGSRMHTQNPTGLLDAVHAHLVASPSASPVTKAYALGFLCHYLLDSHVHPLVYAQQFALGNGGVEGLPFEGAWLHRSIHATIETEIDEYQLTRKLGQTAATYRPHVHMLCCSAEALAEISQSIAGALNRAYGIDAPSGLFATAVELNRIGQRLLDSKGSGLRGRIDFFKPLGYSVSYLRALSHSGAPRDHTMFANDDHLPWPHPYESGKVFDASFDELYDRAFQKALAIMPAFCGAGFDAEGCRQVTQGVNFLGRG